MSKKITYICDLCREKTHINQLFGVMYSANDLKIVSYSVVDTPHMCEKCLSSIMKLEEKDLPF